MNNRRQVDGEMIWVAGLVGLGVALAATPVAASGSGPMLDLGPDTALALGGGAIVGAAGAFAVVDVVQAARGRPLRRDWAKVELVVGMATMAISAPMMLYEGEGELRGAGIFAGVLGAGVTTHATVTLLREGGDRNPRRPVHEVDEIDGDPWWKRTDHSAASLRLHLAAAPDGGGLRLAGSF